MLQRLDNWLTFWGHEDSPWISDETALEELMWARHRPCQHWLRPASSFERCKSDLWAGQCLWRVFLLTCALRCTRSSVFSSPSPAMRYHWSSSMFMNRAAIASIMRRLATFLVNQWERERSGRLSRARRGDSQDSDYFRISWSRLQLCQSRGSWQFLMSFN